MQPQWHGGLAYPRPQRAPPRLADVRELPAPVGARVAGRGPDAEADRAALDAAAGELGEVAAVLIDYSQGGIYHQPGYQDRLAELASDGGGAVDRRRDGDRARPQVGG